LEDLIQVEPTRRIGMAGDTDRGEDMVRLLLRLCVYGWKADLDNQGNGYEHREAEDAGAEAPKTMLDPLRPAVQRFID
jgi:hypothetical protein